jgi:putative sterol carrier protein
MPRFPSLEWCEALVKLLETEPGVLPALREWGGQSVGVVIGKDKGLAKDFCIFAKPHASELKLEELRMCEDEDDLELEEPDYLFRAPFGLVQQLLARKLDPLDVLMKGQIRVEGDMKKLVPFSQKYRGVGEGAMDKIETVY